MTGSGRLVVPPFWIVRRAGWPREDATMGRIATASLAFTSALRSARRRGGAARLTGLGALIVATLVASIASAETIWWVAQGADNRWNTDGNWVNASPPHDVVIPDGTVPVYITTSEHHGLASLPAALIDDTVVAQTRSFYIGGWGSELDSEHGNPGNPVVHSGVLDVTGGELDVDGYMRLGMRGAAGTVNQSGGTVTTDLQVTMGWLSAESSGTYNLSGGTLSTYSLGVGVNGTGYFNMTGGEAYSNTSFIGRGHSSTAGTLPGSGVMNQTGGIFRAPWLYLGYSEESDGTVRVGGDALFEVPTRLVTGVDGSGSITQDGGTIDLGWSLHLGENSGSFGKYTITQGTFLQTHAVMHGDVMSGVYVGREGAGEFSVMGSGAEVDIAGIYEQNGLSTLTFALDGSEGHIPISVGREATFQQGAKLRILLEEGYIPDFDESFVLLTAGLGVIDYGLEIVGSGSSNWRLDTSTDDSVRVIYASSAHAPEPSAGLSFAVGGLVVAAAIRRRAGAEPGR
jgi:hypothetical protein